MTNELQKARELAENLRYSGDAALGRDESGGDGLAALRSHFYQNGLCISKEVTPTLSGRLENVYQRLHIPDTVVEAFVYSSPDIQAACISGGASTCVIRFSSALIETLSSDEFEFVAGHELGHFLLGHSASEVEQDSLEHFMQSRAQEISADRMGLTACNSLEISIRAMMKTTSGLTSRHLRFNVGTFISQLRKQSSHNHEQASHPSMLVRCRALLWFSMIDGENTDKKQSENTHINLDKRIESDFQNYVDGPARNRIEQAKENLSMWLSVRQIAKDSNFSKSEQGQFADLFGKQALEGLKNYLQAIPAAKIQDTIDKQVETARKALVAMIPKASAEEIAKIERLVQERLS